MTTSLDIVNRALDLIGQLPLVSIENPTQKNEKLCVRWYEVSRRRLLAYHPWDFAEAFYSCPRSGDPNDTRYTDMYRLPNDFLELIKVSPGSGESFQYSYEYGEVDWSREGNDILLNASGAESVDIVYTKDFKDASKFSEKFTEALEVYIASKICYSITKDVKLEAVVKEDASNILNEAVSIDGQGKRIRRVEYSPTIAARKGRARSVNAYRII